MEKPAGRQWQSPDEVTRARVQVATVGVERERMRVDRRCYK